MLHLLRRQLISNRLTSVPRFSPIIKNFHNAAIRLQDEKPTKPEVEAEKKPLASPIFTSPPIEEEISEPAQKPQAEKSSNPKSKTKHFKSNAEIRGTSLRNRLLLILFAMGSYGAYYLARDFSEEELELPGCPVNGSLYERASFRLNRNITYLKEPAFKVLLPDQPPAPPGEKDRLTLVINLDETLVKTMWDREHGYRCAKRPGVDRFLGLMSCLFETVIFTSQQNFTAETIIKNIDPYQMYFLHHLFREHTRFHDGKIVKDLSHLNRDLKQIIIMDSNPDAYSLQPDNAIAVPPWDGNPEDTYLLDILPFLETLFITHPDDVREVLKEYHGMDVPKALAEKEKAALEKLASQSKGGLRSLLGGSQRLPMNPIEQRRRLLEANYENQRPIIMAEAAARFKEYEEETKKLMDDQKMTFMEMIHRMIDGQGPAGPPQPTPSQ